MHFWKRSFLVAILYDRENILHDQFKPLKYTTKL